jgi:hypothetical protein
MVTINENSSSRLTITFMDEDEALVTPSAGNIKIVDVKSGTVIRDWSPISPISSSYSDDITTVENRIINSRSIIEVRRVYVTFTYNITKYGSAEYEYSVKNLGGVT